VETKHKIEAVCDFLMWGARQKKPIVLASKNQGVLGEVPGGNIAQIVEDAFDEIEKAAADAPSGYEGEKTADPDAKPGSPDETEVVDLTPPSGGDPDAVPNPTQPV